MRDWIRSGTLPIAIMMATFGACSDEGVIEIVTSKDNALALFGAISSPEATARVDIVSGDDELSQLVSEVMEKNLAEVSAGNRTVTMFSPVSPEVAPDAAQLVPTSKAPHERSRHLNLYHAVTGTVSTTNPETGVVSTMATLSVAVATLGVLESDAKREPTVEKEGVITTQDLERKTFHVVDQLPSTVKETDRKRYSGLPELGAEVAKQGLLDTLSGDGPFTASLDHGDESQVDDINLTVDQIVTYHVLSEEVHGGGFGRTMVDRLSAQAAQGGGDSLEVALDVLAGGEAEIWLRNEASNAVLVDLRWTSGVADVINGELTPMNIAQIASIAGFSQTASLTGSADPVQAEAASWTEQTKAEDVTKCNRNLKRPIHGLDSYNAGEGWAGKPSHHNTY